MSEKIHIRYDRARLRKCKVGDINGMLEKEFFQTQRVLSRFVIGPEGNYLDEAEGLRAVEELDLDEMYAEADKFWQTTEETAVPETSAPASE